MSASELDVPRRELALFSAMPVVSWASGAGIGREVESWLRTRMSAIGPGDPAGSSIAKALFSTDPTQEKTLAAVFDIAA
jgi:hypothetical protein